MRHFTKDDERQMANFTLNIKRCSTPLAIQEMQIKTMRYPYTPIRMANIKKKKLTTLARRNSTTHHWWGNKMVQLLWETVWQFLQKLNLPNQTTTWPGNCTPEHLFQRNGNLFS